MPPGRGGERRHGARPGFNRCPDLHPLIRAKFAKAWPGGVDAVKLIGSMQIKGRATMGGSLCKPAADSVLIAAGGIARVVGPNGAREVPVEYIPTAPGRTSPAEGKSSFR
jgi:CO/xanthine dehydrogenase FAD-binding subunit